MVGYWTQKPDNGAAGPAPKRPYIGAEYNKRPATTQKQSVVPIDTAAPLCLVHQQPGSDPLDGPMSLIDDCGSARLPVN